MRFCSLPAGLSIPQCHSARSRSLRGVAGGRSCGRAGERARLLDLDLVTGSGSGSGKRRSWRVPGTTGEGPRPCPGRARVVLRHALGKAAAGPGMGFWIWLGVNGMGLRVKGGQDATCMGEPWPVLSACSVQSGFVIAVEPEWPPDACMVPSDPVIGSCSSHASAVLESCSPRPWLKHGACTADA